MEGRSTCIYISFLIFWISGNLKIIIIEARLTTIQELLQHLTTQGQNSFQNYHVKKVPLMVLKPHFSNTKTDRVVQEKEILEIQCLSQKFIQGSTAPLFVGVALSQ